MFGDDPNIDVVVVVVPVPVPSLALGGVLKGQRFDTRVVLLRDWLILIGEENIPPRHFGQGLEKA